MIEVPCYSCSSMHHTLYATENGWKLVKCNTCGLLYVNPRPSDEEIEAGVKMGVHRGDDTLDSTGHYMATKVAIYHNVLADIYGTEIQSGKRTWLDVGCGHGELLVALQEICGNNMAVKGIEPNLHKITAACKRGLSVDYFDLASHKEQYDFISLLNVYSHLTSPPEFLRLVRQRLKPAGELLLETGDTAHLGANQHPRPFLLPDHLSFGSQEIVSDILKTSGFEIVSIKKYPSIKLRFMKGLILKDLAKLLVPTKRSQLPALYRSWRVAKHRTDMWIRARVTA